MNDIISRNNQGGFNRIMDNLTLSILFILSMNFLNKFFILTLVFIGFLLINRLNSKLFFNRNFIFLMFFCSTYVIFGSRNSEVIYGINAIFKIFLYLASYFTGVILLKYTDFRINKELIKYLLAIAFGTCIHGILNFIINYKRYGLFSSVHAFTDIWTNQIRATTGQNVTFCIFIGALFYLVYIQKKVALKIIAILTLTCIILYNFMTAGRMVFFILLLVFSICGMAYIKLSKNKSFRTMSYILITITGLVILFNLNVFGIKDLWLQSSLYMRVSLKGNYWGVMEDSRLDRVTLYLDNLSYYPFGGNYMRSRFSYAHNLILDTYDTVGIVSTLFLLAFLINSIKNVLKIFNNKHISLEIKILLIGIFSAVIIQFMIEPILEGSPWLFVLYCMMTGMVDRYLRIISKYKLKDEIRIFALE